MRVNSTLTRHTDMSGSDGNFAGSSGDTLIDGMRLGRFGKPEDIAPYRLGIPERVQLSPRSVIRIGAWARGYQST